MGISLNTNLNALSVRRQMLRTEEGLSKTLQRLSSGLRINQAGDDAAGLGISEQLQSQIRGLNQASRNAQDGISLVQTAENALGEVQNILQRMRELAVEAANDTFTDTNRNNIQVEVNALIEEVDRIAQTTQFNTKVLLDGTRAATTQALTLQIGANAGQVLGFTLLNAQSSTGGLAISGLTVTGHLGASLAIASLDQAISTISTSRAKLGALQNRLEFAIANLDSGSEKLSAANSRLRDADIALETVNLARQQILMQAGIAAQAQANLLPQVVLALLS
jgi:flagellin